MDDLETRHRIGRARLLRRTGKTYDEVRLVVGPVRDETLAGWLRGIPRPTATYRSRRLAELHRRCRQLRADGLTYAEIHELTHVPIGSLSLWLVTCLDQRAARSAGCNNFNGSEAVGEPLAGNKRLIDVSAA